MLERKQTKPEYNFVVFEFCVALVLLLDSYYVCKCGIFIAHS